MAHANLLLEQIKNSIDAIDNQDRLFHAKLNELEAQGYRITDGCQIGDSGGWEYTDYRTGEVLARGTGAGGPDNPKWRHVDGVHEDAGIIYAVKVNGLPESLASDIEAWVMEHEQEARAFIAGQAAQ